MITSASSLFEVQLVSCTGNLLPRAKCIIARDHLPDNSHLTEMLGRVPLGSKKCSIIIAQYDFFGWLGKESRGKNIEQEEK